MQGSSAEVIVVGGGFAGVYAAQQLLREGIQNTVLIEKNKVGGLIYYANEVENIPGFLCREGREVANFLKYIVESYEIPVISDEIIEIDRFNDNFILKGKKRETYYKSKYVIVATGTKPKILGIHGEIYHPEWVRWDEKSVAIIGGGDAALDYALRIKKYGGKPVVIYRRKIKGLEKLRKLCEKEEITFIKGEIDKYEYTQKYSLVINGRRISVDAVICAIGREPSVPQINFEYGNISFPNGKTSIDGFYIIGSTVLGRYRQAMLCGGMGIAAAMSIAEEVIRK